MEGITEEQYLRQTEPPKNVTLTRYGQHWSFTFQSKYQRKELDSGCLWDTREQAVVNAWAFVVDDLMQAHAASLIGPLLDSYEPDVVFHVLIQECQKRELYCSTVAIKALELAEHELSIR